MNLTKTLLTSALALSALTLLACQQDASQSSGPAEQVGKNIDAVTSDARARLDELGNAADGMVDDLKEGSAQVKENIKDIAKDANAAGEGLAEDIKAGAQNVAENARGIASDAKDTGAALVDETSEAIDTSANNAKEVAEEVVKEVEEASTPQ